MEPPHVACCLGLGFTWTGLTRIDLPFHVLVEVVPACTETFCDELGLVPRG